MTLFRGRYRVESARLPGWDYATPAWYFVTLCTRDRACVLGEVREGGVRLSAIGSIVAEEWRRTATVRDNVRLDAWVIMPNHLHGIIRIIPTVPDHATATGLAVRGHGGAAAGDGADAGVETPRRGVSTDGPVTDRPAGAHIEPPAGTGADPALIAPGGRAAHDRVSGDPARLKPGSLGAIVGQFKSVCTKRIHAAGHTAFAWQPRFYDSIIRDERTLDRVRRYIAANPARWHRDRNNPPGLFA